MEFSAVFELQNLLVSMGYFAINVDINFNQYLPEITLKV